MGCDRRCSAEKTTLEDGGYGNLCEGDILRGLQRGRHFARMPMRHLIFLQRGDILPYNTGPEALGQMLSHCMSRTPILQTRNVAHCSFPAFSTLA